MDINKITLTDSEITTISNKITLTINPKNIIKEKKGKSPLYDSTLEQIKFLLNSTNLNILNLHTIIKTIIEIVEETPIKGSEQKTFAIKILREIIDEKTIGEEEAILLLLIDNGTIGNLIDLIIDASKGKLNINALVKTTSGCLSDCVPYTLRKKLNKKK